MAQHQVKFSLPKAEVLHADLEFTVRRNGAAFGRLLISKGAVVWRPKKKSWRGKRLNWGDFARFMNSHGRPEHRGRVLEKSRVKLRPKRRAKRK
jgi:hypothetical protein